MPRIPQEFLDCVIYVYSSRAKAEQGVQFGGSGFLVGVPLSKNPEYTSVYAVTNNHVIVGCDDSPAIRLNTKDDKWDVIDTKKEDWIRHPNADDVRVCPVGLSVEAKGHKFNIVHIDLFIGKEHLGNRAGIGDEVFMVGRFVNVQGRQRNTPALRFGNIAMLPYEPIQHEHGISQESFLIECRSIPGYSGSAVFVYDPYKYRRGRVFLESWDNYKATGPWLLGIDWCHIPTFEPIFDMKTAKEPRPDLKARSNTSMAGVIPAWILREVLFEEELVKQRHKDDEEITRKKAG